MKESYLQDIFEGKSKFNNDELTELNKKLKQGSFNEGQFNEAKYFHNKDKIRSQNNLYEGHIIKPIVGFLNSYEGFGNLYLGIDTGGSGKSRFLDIKPINKKIIKGEDDLRDLIFNKLGVLPASPEKPKMEIKRIEFETGNVFVIFIEKTNNYSVYYSRLTDYIYKRNSDVTNKLSLIENLQLIESKKNPRLSLKLIPKKYTPIDVGSTKKKNSTEITYDVKIINEGLEPSFFTTGMISIKFKGNNKTKIKSTPSIWELTKSDDSLYKYQFYCGMPPQHMPIYPIINSSVGELVISTENFFNLDFEIKILDKKGITRQEFSLKDEFEVGTHTMNLNPINNKINYSPYF